MSEPITRADMMRIIEAVRNTGFPIVGYTGGAIPANPFAAMADAMTAALSASPPRASVSSAHPLKAGVQSGPGQPIDSSVTLEEWERLRDPATLHANLLRGFPATLTPEQRLHLVGSAKIDEIRAEGFRAGIEAAATAGRAAFLADDRKAVSIETIEAAIRALADAPAPNKSEGG